VIIYFITRDTNVAGDPTKIYIRVVTM